jgi:hypothetical protein
MSRSSISNSIILLALIIQHSRAWEIEKIKNQAMRFSQIGRMKLIQEQRQVTFNINVSMVEATIHTAKDIIDKMKKEFNATNDERFMLKCKNLETQLKLKEEVFDDIFVRAQSVKLTRSKRFAGFFGAADGVQVESAFNKVSEHFNTLVNDYNVLKEKYFESVRMHNATFREMLKSSAIQQAQITIQIVEKAINAILNMQVRKRLVPSLVDFASFKNKLAKINASLDEDVNIPYASVHEYYYNLPVEHQVNNNSLKLTMNIPIVEKNSRDFFKIDEIPIALKDELIRLNTGYKYIAVGANDSVLFRNFDSCTDAINNTYHCEPQSALLENNIDNCIIGVKFRDSIDLDLCPMKIMKTEKVVVDKISNKIGVFYSNVTSSIHIMCNGNTSTEKLEAKTVTLLHLDHTNCQARCNGHKIFVVKTIKEDEFNITMRMDVGFDMKQLQERLRRNESIIDYGEFFDDNIGRLKKMEKESDLEVKSIDGPLFQSSLSQGVVILAVVGVIIIVLIVIKMIINRKNQTSK